METVEFSFLPYFSCVYGHHCHPHLHHASSSEIYLGKQFDLKVYQNYHNKLRVLIHKGSYKRSSGAILIFYTHTQHQTKQKQHTFAFHNTA